MTFTIRPAIALLIVATVFALPATSVHAEASVSAGESTSDGLFYGGTLGLSFGDVEYIEISPLVGKHLSPQFSVGVSLTYRYRSDDRYQEELTTNDYGGSVFGRFHATPRLFAQAEYEYVNYEYYNADLSKDRDSADSMFVGLGVAQSAGHRTSLYATALYNFLYEDDGPYDSPWVIRFGVGVGF